MSNADIGDLDATRNTATAFGRMIKEQLVEHRALDLIGGRVFAAKDVTEKKAIAPGAAGGNDFAAIFHDDIGSIEFLFDPHPFKGAKAAGQEGFADFETRHVSFSKIATFHPRCASRVPAVLPAGPPPTIIMSKNSAMTKHKHA